MQPSQQCATILSMYRLEIMLSPLYMAECSGIYSGFPSITLFQITMPVLQPQWLRKRYNLLRFHS